MGPDGMFDLEVAAVVVVTLLIVAVAVLAAWEGAGDDAVGGRADIESALGCGTLMTYGQAATKKAWSLASLPTPPQLQEEEEEEEERCAICLSEYAEADELVRVVPACGHFFHAECGVDRWLRARRTCPLCRGGLWPPRLPRLPRPECPPMPPRWPSP